MPLLAFPWLVVSLLRVRRYRCTACARVWRHDTTAVLAAGHDLLVAAQRS